jgi:hypothetical protein
MDTAVVAMNTAPLAIPEPPLSGPLDQYGL